MIIINSWSYGTARFPLQKQPFANVFKIGVLKNFAIFAEKHKWWNLRPPWDLQLYLKETLTQVFSCEYCEILRIPFFTEHPQTTASPVLSSPLSDYWRFHRIAVEAQFNHTSFIGQLHGLEILVVKGLRNSFWK